MGVRGLVGGVSRYGRGVFWRGRDGSDKTGFGRDLFPRGFYGGFHHGEQWRRVREASRTAFEATIGPAYEFHLPTSEAPLPITLGPGARVTTPPRRDDTPHATPCSTQFSDTNRVFTNSVVSQP